jgi:hypothetical protein
MYLKLKQIFSEENYSLSELFNFIEDATREFNSVLIHSKNQYTTASCVLCSYFLYKFKWSAQKSWDFICIRIKKLSKNSKFYRQLIQVE